MLVSQGNHSTLTSGCLLRVLKKEAKITLNKSIYCSVQRIRGQQKLFSCFKYGKKSAKGDETQAKKHAGRALSSIWNRDDEIESVSSLVVRLLWRCFALFRECVIK